MSSNWAAWRGRLGPSLFILGLVTIWEFATRLGALPERYIPPASRIVTTLIGELDEGIFWDSVGSTLSSWGLGLGIATVIGIPAGLAIGSSKWLDRATRPVVEFLRPVPPVALIPVVVLVFGTGSGGAVFLAAFASVWPLVIQSIYGARSVDQLAIDTAKTLRIGATRRFLVVRVPSAAPYIATGLRLSAAIALILVITSGIIIGTPGVGHRITRAAAGGSYSLMYSQILVTGLIGLAVNTTVRMLERRIIHWRPEATE